MEIMEEGNMMDRVRILLQRDLSYYQSHQTVLQENLCPGVVGGLLDFPHYASFAAVKLVLWWEEEYVAAFRKPSGLLETGVDPEEDEQDRGCGGVAKNCAPSQFVELVMWSATQLLEHVHILSQEALDHADLTVLTGTLGAAALIKNCLWCYNEQLKKVVSDKSDATLTLHGRYKQFHEMAEALAERLLDLHCRLLSLYVLQDADCLNWEDPHPFFEGERGSFVIQMWWLYMQGVREDLWNTVPPKMAQRVLAGMLNESLTILTARYMQAIPSSSRALLLVADLSNLLLCVRELLPSICSHAEELTGHTESNKVLRDVHAKCHELLCCLILRGCPLATLYKVFRKGISGVGLFEKRDCTAFAPWFMLTSPHMFPSSITRTKKLADNSAVALELLILAAQPQASWPLLLKVLMMRDCKVARLIVQQLIIQASRSRGKSHKPWKGNPVILEEPNETGHCAGFLCCGGGECFLGKSVDSVLMPNMILSALIYIVAVIGGRNDLSHIMLPCLDKSSNTWSGCLDKRQVWNQTRPPWLEALLMPLEPFLTPIVETLLFALENGAKLEDTILLAMDCLMQLADCLPKCLLQGASILEDAIPANVHPLADSILIQLLVAGLYSQLVTAGSNAATALAEALCNLGHTKKHLEKIKEFIELVDESVECTRENYSSIEAAPHMAEVSVSTVLLTKGGRRALKIMWQYLQHSSCWILEQLGVLELGKSPTAIPPTVLPSNNRPAPKKLLHTMFHMGHCHFDQLLAGTWELDWQCLLNTPLGLTTDRLWAQLSRRSEFHDSAELLSEHDATVVAVLSTLFNTLPEVHV